MKNQPSYMYLSIDELKHFRSYIEGHYLRNSMKEQFDRTLKLINQALAKKLRSAFMIEHELNEADMVGGQWPVLFAIQHPEVTL